MLKDPNNVGLVTGKLWLGTYFISAMFNIFYLLYTYCMKCFYTQFKKKLLRRCKHGIEQALEVFFAISI